MEYVSIIAENSNNPITITHTTNPNWNPLDVVQFSNIVGDFEVRQIRVNAGYTRNILMPVPGTTTF